MAFFRKQEYALKKSLISHCPADFFRLCFPYQNVQNLPQFFAVTPQTIPLASGGWWGQKIRHFALGGKNQKNFKNFPTGFLPKCPWHGSLKRKNFISISESAKCLRKIGTESQKMRALQGAGKKAHRSGGY